MRSPMKLVLAVAVGAAGAASCGSRSASPPDRTVKVAAASDLSRAFEPLAKAFAAKTNVTAQPVFSASGALVEQIGEGAPYGALFAANREFADAAAATGKCDAASERVYAIGHLALWTRDDAAPADLRALAADPAWARIAIASPTAAPYGKAAKQALTAAGVWDQLGDRVVIADSVQVAMAYARSGAADAAFVPIALARAEGKGALLAIDPSLYPPLEQTAIACGSGERAQLGRQLVQFATSDDGRAILADHGFELPPAPPPEPAKAAP